MKTKTVLLLLLVALALVACAPTDPGTVRARQDTYCPPTAEEWTDWRWESEAHSLRCSWEIEPPEFLERDPEY